MNPGRPNRKFPTHIIVFLAPAFIIYTVFMIYPLIDSLRMSFFAPIENAEGIEIGEAFVGTANYARLLTDDLWAPRLQGAFANNVKFFLIHMLVQNPIGLLLASLLSSQLVRGKAVWRTIFFIPTVLSFVLVGFIWRLILSQLWGISEDFLALFGIENQPWLGLEGTALPTLGLISVWQYIGIPMMLFLAALIGIPEDLIEAARVDGATGLQVFWRIRFPLILPTVGIVTILTFVGNFNAFDLVYVIESELAGPNYSTDLMGTFFYRTFFGVQLQPGNPTMGATIAGVMFAIILAGVLVYMFTWQRRLLKREVEL